MNNWLIFAIVIILIICIVIILNRSYRLDVPCTDVSELDYIPIGSIFFFQGTNIFSHLIRNHYEFQFSHVGMVVG